MKESVIIIIIIIAMCYLCHSDNINMRDPLQRPNVLAAKSKQTN